MPAKKTATMNLRVDPTIKEAMLIAADKEHSSIANMVELLIREHCERVGIGIPEQKKLYDGIGDNGFGATISLPTEPSQGSPNSGVQFQDLSGYGVPDVVTYVDQNPEYFERTEDIGWQQFKPYKSLPNINWDAPNLQMLDLNGDDFADFNTINLRVDLAIKEAMRIAADKEHSSISNMVELLIREHCERVGIDISDKG